MKHLILFCCLLLGAAPAWASHARGGDISYYRVASTTGLIPRYHITVRKFSEGGPAAVPPQTVTELLGIRGGCGMGTAVTLGRLPRTTMLNGAPTNCQAIIPYYIVEFEGDVDLPADRWLLYCDDSARNFGLQNMTMPLSTTSHLEAYFDNSVAPNNTSPRFESGLQPYMTPATISAHSYSAFDADGDSLRYEFILPKESCSVQSQATLSPHYQLSAATGAMTAMPTTPNTVGGYVINTKVSEYRRLNGVWVQIGYVMRESQYIVYTSSNQPPSFTGMQVDGGATQALGSPIAARSGQLVGITLTATDPDAGQLLRFAALATTVVPGLTLTPVGTQQVRLNWDVPPTLPPGRYRIPVAVLDNGCDYSASDERTLTFVVGAAAPLGTRAGAATLASAWPTPFREQVQFAAPAGQPVLVADALGRVVATLHAGPDGLVRWLPAAGLAPGFYLARTPTGTPLARLLRGE